MTIITAVAAVIFDDAGRVLLVQRGRPPNEGLWTLPGGSVERDESREAACAREVREETGLDVTVGHRVTTVNVATYAIDVFGARGTGTPRAGDDARDARWFSPEELAAIPTTHGLLDVIVLARATSR